jgi:hypothetical protein
VENDLKLGAGRSVVLWGLFFLICFGLGYPTLNRYDPHKLGADWAGYYDTVLHRDGAEDFPYSERVLVPAVARPFYLLARGHVGTWDPVWFGLLVANSLFAATAVFLLLCIGLRVLGDLPLALFACALYLLNYVVPNLWLSGMVDSAEACLMLLVTWALFAGRWWMLPLIGIAGGMAKQSFLPFATVFAGTSWLVAERPAKRYGRLAWVAALGVTSAVALMLVQRAVTGHAAAPWTLAKWWNAGGYLGNLLRCFKDQQFWYAFLWLLPLGVWRLGRLPRPWVAASLATGVTALALGAYADLQGTVNRPLFTAVGPVLTLSAALLLAEHPGRERAARQ